MPKRKEFSRTVLQNRSGNKTGRRPWASKKPHKTQLQPGESKTKSRIKRLSDVDTRVTAPPPTVWSSTETKFTIPDVPENKNLVNLQVKYYMTQKLSVLRELKDKTLERRAMESNSDQVVVLSV